MILILNIPIFCFSENLPAKGTHAARYLGHHRYRYWLNRPSPRTENSKIVQPRMILNVFKETSHNLASSWGSCDNRWRSGSAVFAAEAIIVKHMRSRRVNPENSSFIIQQRWEVALKMNSNIQYRLKGWMRKTHLVLHQSLPWCSPP